MPYAIVNVALNMFVMQLAPCGWALLKSLLESAVHYKLGFIHMTLIRSHQLMSSCMLYLSLDGLSNNPSISNGEAKLFILIVKIG